MDWTTPLKSQQVDFIARLDREPATLLHCPIPGVHSERVTIAGETLKQIRAFCRQSLVRSELPSAVPLMPVREMLLQKLPLEVAIEAIATVLADRVSKVHPQERQYTHRSLNFLLKDTVEDPQESFGLQVKIYQGNHQTARWKVDRQDINQNAAVICILLPNDIEDNADNQTKYQPILAGFLPTNQIPISGESVDLILSDLLYVGGLRGYLETLTMHSISTQWLRPLTTGSNYVYPLAIGGDGETIVSSSYDGTIKIWHLGDRKLLDYLGGQCWSSYPIAGSSGVQQFPNNRSEQTIYNIEQGLGTLIHSLPGHSSGVSALAIGPNGQTLASGGYDGNISLWNLKDGQLLRKFVGHSGTVKPIAIGPDGCTLATGSTDKTLKLWNLNSAELLRSFPVSEPPVSIAISPDGQTIVSGSIEGLVKIWHVSSGDLEHQLIGHAGLVRSLAISADGQTLASSSTEKTIKLWNLRTGEPIDTFTGHTEPMMAFTVKQDSKTLELNVSHREQSGWELL